MYMQHEDSQVHAILPKHSKQFSRTGNLKTNQVKMAINKNTPHCKLTELKTSFSAEAPPLAF